jgi:hypothetical protein
MASAAALGMTACSLLVGTGDLAGGGSPDAGAPGPGHGPGGETLTGDNGGPGGPDGSSDPGSPGVIKLATPPVTTTFVAIGDSTLSTSATMPVAAGNLLVVAASWTYGTNLGSPPTMTVSDSLGNAWSSATMAYDNYQTGPSSKCKADAQIFYAASTGSGSDVVTLTNSQQGNTMFGFTVMAYSGLAKAPDDFGGTATPPGGANLMSSPPLNLTGSKDLVVAVFTDTAGGGLMVPGNGFTLRGSNTGLYSMVEDNLPGVAAGRVAATALLPNNATDNCWSVAVAGFKAQ